MLGYESLYSIRNFGSVVFLVLISLVFVGLVNLIGLLPCESAKKIKNKVNNSFFWNVIFGFLSESFLMMLFCSSINMHYFKWNNFGNIANSLFTVLILVLSVAFLFIVLFYYRKNFHKIEDKETYEEFHTKTNIVFKDFNTETL